MSPTQKTRDKLFSWQLQLVHPKKNILYDTHPTYHFHNPYNWHYSRLRELYCSDQEQNPYFLSLVNSIHYINNNESHTSALLCQFYSWRNDQNQSHKYEIGSSHCWKIQNAKMIPYSFEWKKTKIIENDRTENQTVFWIVSLLTERWILCFLQRMYRSFRAVICRLKSWNNTSLF